MLLIICLVVLFSPTLEAAAISRPLDCPNSHFNDQTWFGVTATDCYMMREYTANLTSADYCYDEINFVLMSYVNLADPTATQKKDSVADPVIGKKTCGLNFTDIEYCDSHCMDKDVENALVNASMMISDNSNSIWAAAKDNLRALGKGDWPLTMIEPFPWHSVIDFQYYDDMNFCIMDILYVLPAGDYYPAWPFRSFFVTQKTVPTK